MHQFSLNVRLGSLEWDVLSSLHCSQRGLLWSLPNCKIAYSHIALMSSRICVKSLVQQSPYRVFLVLYNHSSSFRYLAIVTYVLRSFCFPSTKSLGLVSLLLHILWFAFASHPNSSCLFRCLQQRITFSTAVSGISWSLGMQTERTIKVCRLSPL